jgi:DNA-binding SARP family transcriptional activator/predicted ATPase
VRDRQGLVSVGTPQQRALLALLILNANEVVSRDTIVDELWGESPPASAPKLVQTYVSRLRKALGTDPTGDSQFLVTQAPGYLLRVELDQVDVRRFERLAEEGREALSGGRPRVAAGRLREALALWRGPALADFAFERFAEAEIGRLEELRLSVIEDRIAADLALGRGDVIGELETLIARHPLRERLREMLMLALYRAGRQTEALDTYREARSKLVEDVGVEPGPELQRLERAILAQDPALDRRPVEEAAPERSRAAFVGRERELGELTGRLEDALAGHGRLVMLVGEPGIGKSRLADELIDEARARGARTIVGRCWEAGGAPAYWPWVQSLRAYIGETEPVALREQLGEGAADLAQLLPELRDLFPDLPDVPAVEPEGARFRLFEAVSAFLRRATRDRGLVLVLDDLHAADEPSLLLLRFVARGLGDNRLLVVCAFRDVAPTMRNPLVATVAELIRERGVTQIPLSGLSKADIAEYIPASTGVEPAPGLVVAVHTETEGNPLFVAETVRLLADEGTVGDPKASLQLPPGVRAVIDQRVSRLSDRCRQLLMLASVLGREFGLDPLARFAGLPRDELIDALDEALAEQILAPVPGSPERLRFGHALIRDSVYEELTPGRRMQLHRDAAEALAAAHAQDLGPHLTEVAHHYLAAAPAGWAEEAVDYARRAGDRAASLLAHEEAARLYGMALSLAEGGIPRWDLLLALGDAHARAGDTPAAKRAFREAAELAEDQGDSERLARAALGYAGRIIWERQQDDDFLVPLLERALEALGDDDSALRVRLLARLAGGPLRGSQFPPARRFALSQEALEMARRLDDPATLAYALDAYLPANESPANAIESLDLCTELLEVAGAVGDKERMLEAHEHRLERFFELGEIGQARADLEAMGRLADELRQPAQQWLVVVCRGRLALHEGRFEQAGGLIEHARELGEQALSWNAGVAFGVQSYMLRRELGRLDEALELIANFAREYPDYELWEYARASLVAALGLEDEAKEAFEALATDDFGGLPFDANAWFVGMGLLAETAGSLGDARRAAVLYERLLPYAGRVAVIYPELSTGSVSRYLGLLAGTAERWAEAEQHFEAALDANERIGARPWLAHTLEDYARMLAARGERGDRERACQLAASAREGYRSLGMAGLAAPLEELERSLSAGRGR